MKISLCMIVKDEESELERILTCVQQFADEIIIVNTGSNNNTIKIAQKYTDKVFYFVWQDDFSLARNYSFSHATCDYIMWLDADDFIDDENIQKICELKNQESSADVYMMKYITAFDEQGNPAFSFYRERILKKSNNYFWEGFVHEAITIFGDIRYTEIEVQHKKQNYTQSKRNLKIYQKLLKKKRILNARESYYYAKELYYNGYYKKSIITLQHFLKMENKFYPNEIDAHLTISRCYSAKQEIGKAIDSLFYVFKNYCPTSEICCELASLLLVSNNYDCAIFFYQSALNCERNTFDNSFVRSEFDLLVPCLQLTYLYYKKSAYEKALYYHNLVKQKYPLNKKVIYNDNFFK